MAGRYFYASVLGFCIGIVFSLTIPGTFYFGLFLIFIGVSSTFMFRVFDTSWIPYTCILCLCFIGVGIIRTDAPEFFSNRDALSEYVDNQVRLIGKISDEPDTRQNNVQIIIDT